MIHDHLTSKSGSLQSALSPFLFVCAHGSSQHPLVKCCHLSGPWQAENISQSIKAVSLQCVSMVGNDWFTTDPWELRSILSCKPHRIPNYITGRLESRKSCFRTTHPNIFAHPIVQTKQFSHVLTIGCFVIRKLLAEPSGNQIELSQLQKPIQRCSGLSLFSGTDSNNNNYSDI